MADLFADYVAAKPELLAFYAAPTHLLFATLPHAGGWDDGVVEEMCRRSGMGLRGDEAVIITGQQPGLFTGPLYTIYKAITAILAAERLEREQGVPCVPVFWVGGDDHDFEEVRSAHVLSRRHTVETLRYVPDEDVTGRSMFRVPLARDAHALIDAAQTVAPGSERADDVALFLHEALDEAQSFSDWMARIMGRLYQDTPLRVFAPDWLSARRAAAPVFARELADPLATTRAVNAAGARLASLGYGAQVVKGETECAFFLEVAKRRCKVLFEGGRFVLPEADADYSRAELEAILDVAPERFTANVALRCVVQQVLFPAVAYVAGPGELAYWGQLKDVFARHGQRMPVVYPRLRAVLTSVKLNKLLAKYGFVVAGLDAPEDSLVEQALRAAPPGPALSVVAEHGPRVADAVAELSARLAEGQRSAAEPGRAFEQQVREALGRLERGLLYLDQTRTETVRGHVARLTAALMPGRSPQERTLNVLSFLFEHGWGLVPRIARELTLDDFGLQEIEL